jgi:hypothetical protein
MPRETVFTRYRSDTGRWQEVTVIDGVEAVRDIENPNR